MDDLQGQTWAGEETGRVVEIDVESGPGTFGGSQVPLLGGGEPIGEV